MGGVLFFWVGPEFRRFPRCLEIPTFDLPGGLFEDVQFLEAPVEGSAADAEFYGGLAAVATALLEGAEDERGFGIVKIPFPAGGGFFEGEVEARHNGR